VADPSYKAACMPCVEYEEYMPYSGATACLRCTLEACGCRKGSCYTNGTCLPCDAPSSHPPSSQPPSSQPPISQPPSSQPPISQPPISQPPISQPPSPTAIIPAAICPPPSVLMLQNRCVCPSLHYFSEELHSCVPCRDCAPEADTIAVCDGWTTSDVTACACADGTDDYLGFICMPLSQLPPPPRQLPCTDSC
jgi:hypothetical protein